MAAKRSNRFDITGLRLANQHLTTPSTLDAAAVVRRLGAVQSQDYAGGKWGIGLRAKGLTDAMVDRAIDEGAIVRTHVLRPTWHFMAADDARWILALTGPRVHAANAHYTRKLGLDDAIFTKSTKAITKALGNGQHLTREELGEVLRKAGVEPGIPQRLAYLMMYAELNAVITSGRRRGKQFTYALFDARVPASRALDRDEALAELARRYFSTRSPATGHDFSWWSGLTKADSKRAIEALGSEIIKEEIDDTTYWHTGIDSPKRSRRPSVHLLPNYDEYFIGFTDRSAILNVVKGFSLVPGDPMFTSHVVVLGGQLIGGWKRAVKPKSMQIELNLVRKLSPDERPALKAAVKRYADFLELPVDES